MQPTDCQLGVHHPGQSLAPQRRDQLLTLYRATRNCSTGKVSDALLAQRYLERLSSPYLQIITLDHSNCLEASVMIEQLSNGDCAISAVCATSGSACRSLLRHALSYIRACGSRRIVSGVAPEVKIVNLVFGALGFVSTGMREREPGVVVFDVERSASEACALELNEAVQPEWSGRPGYEGCHARTFTICAPESAQYAHNIATLRSETRTLFAAGQRLIGYTIRDGSARCLFGTSSPSVDLTLVGV